MRYELDSFIQYFGRLPTIRTRSKNVRGHYIGFRKINDEWFCFDDGVVHRVQIQQEFNVNLVVYRRNDTPAFMPPVDLSGIPHLQKSVVLNRKNSSGDANDNKTTNGTSSQRPPLITPSSTDGNGVRSAANLPSIEKPQRMQPYRRNKDYVVYYAPNSTSSSEEPMEDRTHSDTDYIPPKSAGIFCLNICHLCSHVILCQWSIEGLENDLALCT